MQKKPYRRQLWEMVGRQVLPCLAGGKSWKAFLIEPCVQLPRELAVDFHAGEPLKLHHAEQNQSQIGFTRSWAEAHVHNKYSPYLGFVMGGEIDLRIGITEQTATQLKGKYAASDYMVVTIPENSFFLIPPGVPHGRGLGGHWERRYQPSPETRIFWTHFFAPGVQCHMSWYRSDEYISMGSYFLHDPHLLPAASALITELRLQHTRSLHITHSLLSFVYFSVERDLHKLLLTDSGAAMPQNPLSTFSSQIVSQASKFIETHYQEKISVERVASHCFVSSSHLSRLFKQEKGMPLHEYITQVRLGNACALLADTSLGISMIGSAVGYRNRTYFCQVFQRRFGCSPREYRKRDGKRNFEQET